ncbi:Conserved TM helix repeat-containing protein [Micromonospora lupini str. Lupac 08]|uniref:Conserved TM helix repeat-containing protein n=1 Tax=Micromonospora lupini str. Lupac 08 TaxID=1150864 RepID=I0L313_9ACTN|nr:Conserved TM helix repeat-containing protein [Micromonospora lupini str. Lupac 08]
MSDNVSDAVGDALRSVMLFLPKAVAFLAILVAGWLIAKAVLKIVEKVLERVGFDRAVERGGIRRALSRSRYDASDIVAKLVYYGVLLLTLQLAFGIWGPNPISDLITAVVAWLPRAFVAIVIVVVAAAIANAVKDIISGALGGLSYGRVLAGIASVFILGLGVIAALNQIGVATAVTTPVLIAVLATVGGILVVGVGGGLIRPMQSRWEAWLTRAEQESALIATHARAYQASRREAEAELARAAATRPDPVATPTPTRSTDPEATQMVSRPTDPDATQVTARSVDPDATQVTTRSSDPEATQVVTRPADPDATQVVRSSTDDTTQVVARDAPAVGVPARESVEDTTQVVARPADPDATQVVGPGREADTTQVISGGIVPGQRSSDDSDTTTVIPPVDPNRR